MPITFDGKLGSTVGRYAIVVSRYHNSITQRLLDGALNSLQAAGVADDNIRVVWVPGAWELSVVAARFARCQKVDAMICLGAVIRGETTHDQYINSQVASSLGKLSLQYELPISFGLLTCETMEQAIHRAGGNVGNKGMEAAEAAIEMVNVMQMISSELSD
ncbi:MAG: 6,7-dimethyl-8-ribityllumazine synthase [Planctomycetaceae bacterium]|jgi:6,7-dimethyl-8-ribityllumazine synthase|nr:6,7-dimethyl-8-ribityllumazine synthase [Planctomycetaceae bacterium]